MLVFVALLLSSISDDRGMCLFRVSLVLKCLFCAETCLVRSTCFTAPQALFGICHIAATKRKSNFSHCYEALIVCMNYVHGDIPECLYLNLVSVSYVRSMCLNDGVQKVCMEDTMCLF